MIRDCSTLPINARFLQIGVEIFPVYGNDERGWSLDWEVLPRQDSAPLRYESLDELFFVLVNMTTGGEGIA